MRSACAGKDERQRFALAEHEPAHRRAGTGLDPTPIASEAMLVLQKANAGRLSPCSIIPFRNVALGIQARAHAGVPRVSKKEHTNVPELS